MSGYFLDPKTAEMSRAMYDAKGYDNLHLTSIEKANFNQGRSLDDLLLNGYSLDKIVDNNLASEIINVRGNKDESRSKPFDQVFNFKDNQALQEILKKILTGDIEKKISNYYYSNFAVIFAVLLKTLPKEEEDLQNNPSMAWHCDMGPSNHLKLLITLTDNDDHGGGTEYIDRSTTDLLKKVGYGFLPVEHRKFDLSPLAKKNNIPFKIDLLKPKCGEGIFFEPARTMHRGFRPTNGENDRLVLGFIPWTSNWEDFEEKNPGATFNNIGMAFPNINP